MSNETSGANRQPKHQAINMRMDHLFCAIKKLQSLCRQVKGEDEPPKSETDIVEPPQLPLVQFLDDTEGRIGDAIDMIDEARETLANSLF